jgi:hypothetical protein
MHCREKWQFSEKEEILHRHEAPLLISESLTRFPKEKTTYGQIPSSHPLVDLFASRLVIKMIICALDELIPKPIPSALIRCTRTDCISAGFQDLLPALVRSRRRLPEGGEVSA